MKKRILELEKKSSALEPSPRERKKVTQKIVSYADAFLNRLAESKTYNYGENMGAGILKSPISEKATSIDRALKLFYDYIDCPGLNPASGGHLAYIPGGGIYYSALGDYLADVTNRYAGVFFAGPGSVRMENMLIQWLAQILGYPKNAAGNLTSGGSLANLIGIVTAREAKNVRARDVERAVIYMTHRAHHSVDKAIRIAGLKEAVIRYVAMDESFRMKADDLRNQIQNDLAAGLRPFLIIASAGTTDVGAIDPLVAIGGISREFGLWYHVDAAYGGFFVLTSEGKRKLQGIEMSDSVVIDPHKGLFLPYGLGVAIVKDRTRLQAAHYYSANYMQDAAAHNEDLSPAEVSPELTKPFRGLRLWLPLKLCGVKPFRACLEEKLLLAKYFYNEVRKLGFETGPQPELSVVTYRYVPKTGDASEFNRRLLDLVVKDGRIFISSTMLNGNFTLRFACLVFRTHLKQVDLLLQILKEKVEYLTA